MIVIYDCDYNAMYFQEYVNYVNSHDIVIIILIFKSYISELPFFLYI